MTRTLADLPEHLQGLQAFVCTPFTDADELDLLRFRENLSDVVHGYGSKPAGCFVACGTGELWALNAAEHRALVRAAVAAVDGSTPVVAGVGYGTKLAVELARAAEAEGADGILVFPPYLVAGPQAGLYQHLREVALAVEIGVIVYHRDNAVLSLESFRRLLELPNVIGVKDGYGDLRLLSEMQAAVDRPFVFGNGMPVAETYAPVYGRFGVRSYSPGIIDFLPELAWVYDRMLECGDTAGVNLLLEEFYRPLAALRSQTSGLGISLVKAGLRLRGRPAGRVRSPLIEATSAQFAELERLIERGLQLSIQSGG
jgi:5-dehydro-4-deoxyglucarate dehydratase